MEYGHDKDTKAYVRVVYGTLKGKSPWYPLHDAANRWDEKKDATELEYNQSKLRAIMRDRDGRRGPREYDANGYLLYPNEDEVPIRNVSSSDE